MTRIEVGYMGKKNRIFVSGPSITQKEIDYVTEAVKTAWYDNANYYNNKFEEEFAKYVGRKYAITLPSCTSAIHLSLLALGIKSGDEVIVPDVTWIATAAPISYVGATPVFADIDEKTWCIDAKSLKERITTKTKAIITVDLYGNMPEYDEIVQLANEYNIPIIEDAAEAMGSTYKDKRAGSFGEAGVFSFHGSKIMTTGEGGMLVTDDKAIYDRCLKLRDHGRAEGSKMFWNDEVGYKYKMSSLQAALGLAQLERIDELVAKKREMFSWYKKELENIEGIWLNYENENFKSIYWMITVCWDKNKYNLSKEEFIDEMRNYNIDTRPFFYPLSEEPAYKNIVNNEFLRKKNLSSYKISAYAINLPSGMNVSRKDVKIICYRIKEVLQSKKQNMTSVKV